MGLLLGVSRLSDWGLRCRGGKVYRATVSGVRVAILRKAHGLSTLIALGLGESDLSLFQSLCIQELKEF